MKLKKSILFWSALSAAVYGLTVQILAKCGLCLRVFLREPLSFLIVAGIAAGILQLLLHIRKKAVKIVTVVLWSAAAVCGLGYSWLCYGFYHLEDSTAEWQGRTCVREYEHVMWASYSYYYEEHGPLLRGTELLYKE